MMLYMTKAEEVPVKRPPRRKYISANIKRHHAGISQSSCSDGSLLSVGSSEIEEDSSSGHHHSHDHSARSDQSDLYNSSEPPTGVAPLSHSAAKHKMAVRPRRTHGAPRRKKNNPIAASALPITPELNEDMIRSTTPEVKHKTSEVVTESFSSSITTKHTIKEQHLQVNRELQRILDTPSDTKLKSSSLPPGLALSQLAGHAPKLSVAETPTPRSSIKRSKSSTQDQSLRDSSPKCYAKSTETHINSYQSEERVTKYRSDKKYAEESCPEKKSKSEKKIENEIIKSKKEESFFSRLLLRKSGKKPKKDQTDGEQQDVKRSKMDKNQAQYKPVDSERSTNYGEGYRPVPVERTHKSAAQKAFANQMHKRLDNKGGYVQDSAYKDVYSAAKVAGAEYSITDLKVADETDKMLNQEMRSRFSRREEFSEKTERTKRSTSKEVIDENKRESFNLHHDKSKRPASVQRLIDPLASKAFISNEVANRAQEEMVSPTLVISDEEPPIRAMRIKNVHSDFMFHSGSMPKNIPYFNPGLVSSSSPPRTVRHQSSENVRNRSSERVSEFSEKIIESKRTTKTDDSYISSGVRSLGDEFVESRSSIGKSHSFRYASETTSISSQENQMPSLPAIVGISEPLLESWEVNYRRNVSDRHDFSKRVSARNYNIMHGTAEANYDSLPSTDSSYLDSLKNDVNEDRKLFTNSIHITVDSHKRDSDISQIEAKIDDIISSPKPLIAPILKSSSLDSVKSSPEKPVDDRRKTISVETALSQGSKISNVQKDTKQDTENFVSVTHINKEQTPTSTKNGDAAKTNKSDEKPQKSGKPRVPEFLNIQLNKVDAKPATNVVLTANVTPKKLDSPQAERERETDTPAASEVEPARNVSAGRDSTPTKTDASADNLQFEERTPSPACVRRSAPPAAPQSPSTPKNFFKRKAASVELQDRPEKPRTNSTSTDGSSEKIFDNISIDQNSHSSFGSKSSILSTDSDGRAPDRDDAVVFRKKPAAAGRDARAGERRPDDEPELMKVFARRSLKIKDSEADDLARDVADSKGSKGPKGGDTDDDAPANRTKILKNEFNASIKSRDSDKENEDTGRKERASEERRAVDIAARVSQFGAHYQRGPAGAGAAGPGTGGPGLPGLPHKRDSAPAGRADANRYRKEVSDSTPEKRLRNRTFPDPSADRGDIKSIAKSEAMASKADTLSKRPAQRPDDRRASAGADRDGVDTAGAGAGGEGVAAPQFKGILQMRAEWERRAKQGMTK